MDRYWCMCTELKVVYRDGWSTCFICGGKDAYGLSKDRPKDKHKVITHKEDIPTPTTEQKHKKVNGIPFPVRTEYRD